MEDRELLFKLNKNYELEPLISESNISVIRLEDKVSKVVIRIDKKMEEYHFYSSYRVNDDKIGMASVDRIPERDNSKYFYVGIELTSHMTYKKGVLFLQLKWENEEDRGRSIILGLTIHDSLSIEDDYEPNIFVEYESKLNDIIKEAEDKLNFDITDIISEENSDMIPTVKGVMDYIDKAMKRSSSVQVHHSFNEFPSTGAENVLYYNIDNNGLYYWNINKQEYVLTNDTEGIIIDGGQI